MYCNKENINILTSLLVKWGVKHVVVCPGSRNAPLVHNFSECPDMICHPATDERSAGFLALGIREQLSSPVAVCVTSGSALLNVLPAAAEATYRHEGIIVISADRPREWIDQLDGQTLPQQDALGRFVAKSVNLPEIPSPLRSSSAGLQGKNLHWLCNRLVNEAMIALQQPGHPSVHINVPITEPLFEFTVEELPDERKISYLGNWQENRGMLMVTTLINKHQRPLFVIGQTRQFDIPAEAMQRLEERFVVLSEPLSGVDSQPAFTDQMLYTISRSKDSYHPDLIIYIGGHTVSKRLRQFLRSFDNRTKQVLISEDTILKDVSMQTDFFVTGKTSTVITDIAHYCTDSVHSRGFYNKWQQLRERVKARHETFQPEYSQMLAVKLFEESLTFHGVPDEVFYANSMSVRLASLYADHYCHCNRGLNGIEGSLSVAAGASLVQALNDSQCTSGEEDIPEPHTYCVIGDLSFFYDENALWLQELSGNFRILLLNNSQGGIFRNLKGLEQSPVCDVFVAARHDTSAEGICQQFHVNYFKATDEASLKEGITHLISDNSDRPLLLEVITDINIDEQQFKAYYHNLKK